MDLAHVIVDASGTILRVDPGFCAIMRGGERAFLGRNMLEFTAPADRERCVVLLETLLQNGEPAATTKRLIRCDTSHAWVENRMALTDPDAGLARVEIRLDERAAPANWVDPSVLLVSAEIMVETRRAREGSFPGALFADHAWDILLAAYIIEARGGVPTIAALHQTLTIGANAAARWVRALYADGLLDYEQGHFAGADVPFSLSSKAHAQFERFLTEFHQRCERLTPVSELDQ